MKRHRILSLLVFLALGFAAPEARTEDSAQHTLTPADQARHLDLVKKLSPEQTKALSGVYPGFRILAICSGRFSGADRDELVLGIWKLQESKERWKREVHRVGLIWGPKGWEAHVIDDELEKDEAISGAYPMGWHYTLKADGFSAQMKCGLASGIEGDPDLTYSLGDKPLFDLEKEGLAKNKRVCFATDDVYNNWDCVVYSPKDGRFRLWFQQAHAD